MHSIIKDTDYTELFIIIIFHYIFILIINYNSYQSIKIVSDAFPQSIKWQLLI